MGQWDVPKLVRVTRAATWSCNFAVLLPLSPLTKRQQFTERYDLREER